MKYAIAMTTIIITKTTSRHTITIPVIAPEERPSDGVVVVGVINGVLVSVVVGTTRKR